MEEEKKVKKEYTGGRTSDPEVIAQFLASRKGKPVRGFADGEWHESDYHIFDKFKEDIKNRESKQKQETEQQPGKDGETSEK